jgi:hypothetical protein
MQGPAHYLSIRLDTKACYNICERLVPYLRPIPLIYLL